MDCSTVTLISLGMRCSSAVYTASFDMLTGQKRAFTGGSGRNATN